MDAGLPSPNGREPHSMPRCYNTLSDSLNTRSRASFLRVTGESEVPFESESPGESSYGTEASWLHLRIRCSLAATRSALPGSTSGYSTLTLLEPPLLLTRLQTSL
ncbi:hypothetical protein HBI25_046250 [Parastagonospora nodorum]|nr:hypothetical protein HBI25_046250 [Parastagonospora nodorum]